MPGGAGFASKYPRLWLQPSSRICRSWSALSIPSAVTLNCKLFASATIARMIVVSRVLVPIWLTNDRSILTASIENRLR